MSRSICRFVGLLLALACAVPLSSADEKSAEANLAKKTDDVKNWRLEQHEQAKGAIAVADGAIVFDVTKEDGTDWHVQAFQTPLDFKEGQQYTISFKAKSDGEHVIHAQAGIDQDDWHMIGIDEEVTLGKEWKDYQFTFTATNVAPMKNRIGFVLGASGGKVYVKDLIVKPAKK